MPVAHQSGASVVAVDVPSGGVPPTSPSTGSFTNTSGNLLICGIGLGTATGAGNQGTIGTVTYGGQTMTLLGSQRTGANSESIDAIYYLLNPPTGSNTLSVAHSWTGTSVSYDVSAGCASFTGAGVPYEFASTSTTSATTLAKSTTTAIATGEMSFAILSNGSGSGVSQNQTLSFFCQDKSSTQNGSFRGAVATGAGSTISHSESWTGSDHGIVCVCHIPVSSSATKSFAAIPFQAQGRNL